MSMAEQKQRERATLTYFGVPLRPDERRRLDRVCGPRRRWKRGEWVREAIVAALDRQETAEQEQRT